MGSFNKAMQIVALCLLGMWQCDSVSAQLTMRSCPFRSETNGVTSHLCFTRALIIPNTRTRITIRSRDSTYFYLVIDTVLSRSQEIVISQIDQCEQARERYPFAMVFCEPRKPSGLYMLTYATKDSVFAMKYIYMR